MPACNVNEKEVCVYAQRAADNAVKKTFAILGVDIEEPEQVKQFQQDLRFGSFLRRAAEKGVLALIVSAFTAIGVLILIGLKAYFDGGK
jgi:hypothetical protein